MAEQARGKRGTVRLDPTATIPEAAPLRFVEGEDALAAADREELARPSAQPKKPAPKPLNPESDRQEFANTALRPGPRGPTLELRKVDVSRADPRKMKTVKGKGLTYDPLLDGDAEPGEPVERPSRALLALAVAVGLAFIGAVILLVKSRLGH